MKGGTKEMVNEKREDLSSWDDFVNGTFLKAINIRSPEDGYICIHITKIIEGETKRLRLTLEREEQEYEFDLNKTNAKKTVELGIKKPSDLLEKKLFFKKVLVRNPKTNQEVEGLRIWKIE
jgi:hypothetical protein